MEIVEELDAFLVVAVNVDFGVFEAMLALHLAVNLCANAMSAIVLLDVNRENPFVVPFVKIEKPPSNRMTLGNFGKQNKTLLLLTMVSVILPD